jgi:hypothetical protein
MRGLVLLALAALVPATALATVPPPPVMDLHPGAKTAIVSFAPPPARVACDGRDVVVVQSSPIHPKAWQPWTPPVGANPASALPQLGQSLTFSVDADGAVIDLKRGPGFAPWSGDEQAAIVASWRFAPGAPAKGCKLDLAPTQTALADTAPAKLFEIAAFERRNTPPAVRGPGQGRRLLPAPSARARPHRLSRPARLPRQERVAAMGGRSLQYRRKRRGARRQDRRAERRSGLRRRGRLQHRRKPLPVRLARTGCYAAFRAKAKATPAPARPDIKASSALATPARSRAKR